MPAVFLTSCLLLAVVAACDQPAAPPTTTADASVGACGEELSLCSGVCVDTSVDPWHCGLCDRACPGGFSCALGQCTATSAPSLVDVAGDVGRSSSIAVDAEGEPHIAYYDESDGSDHNLRYATRVDGRWHVEIADGAGHVGDHPSIAMRGTQLHVSYYDQAEDELRYAVRGPDGWRTTQGPIGGRYTSIALDDGGTVHVSHYDYTTEDLLYSFQDAEGFHWETVESDGDVGRFSSLALVDGQARIAYYDQSNGRLRIASQSRQGWSLETADVGDVGSHASLAIDARGNEHVAYYDAASSSLRYAVRDGQGWRVEVVDDDGDVGSHGALAIDDSGRPHICYRDETRRNLRCAVREDMWRIVVADEDGDVGEGVAVAIDERGQLHVSYRDVRRHALKYVRPYASEEF